MARQVQKMLPKKTKRKVPKGVVHIQASFNNTIVTIATLKGEVISWCSSGVCGFKGARKGTPFAAKTAATTAAKQSIAQGMRQAKVMVKGPWTRPRKLPYGDCKKQAYALPLSATSQQFRTMAVGHQRNVAFSKNDGNSRQKSESTQVQRRASSSVGLAMLADANCPRKVH